MRVVNEKFETITEYDLTAGRLIPKIAVKEDAEPIDNVTKFAWAEEDWEEVQMYVPDNKTVVEHTVQDDTDAMLIDHEYRLTLLELGIVE
jgi:hypothetical protein